MAISMGLAENNEMDRREREAVTCETIKPKKWKMIFKLMITLSREISYIINCFTILLITGIAILY